MNKKIVYTSAALIILVAIVGAIYYFKSDMFRSIVSSGNLASSTEDKISGYVAVFLTNNQVYFGKISDLKSPYPTLTDVYYLRVQRSLVPPAEDDQSANVKVEDKKKQPQGSPAPQQQQTKTDLSLVKLGNELHGPKDEIKINRDQILYFEKLKDDGKVVKAISDYREKNK